MCIEGSGQGIIDYSIYPNNIFSIELSGTSVSINGNALGFDTSRTQCAQSAYKTTEIFSSHVAEIAIDSGFADTIH